MACKKSNKDEALYYPGAAIDQADNERTTVTEVKERTSTLNDNPRNNGDIV